MAHLDGVGQLEPSAPNSSPSSCKSLPISASPVHHPRNFRSHQRRQSVARLLPDISKLRLLSWLVEASSELISCDIAIMDGVYAKLNRSRESLLFWNQQQQQQQQHRPQVSNSLASPKQQVANNNNNINNNNKSEISQQRRNQRLTAVNSGQLTPNCNPKQPKRTKNQHHSLPMPTMASPSLLVTNSNSLQANSVAVDRRSSNTATPDNHFNDDADDSQSDEDDNSSSATSLTTSSGIHGASSLSSASVASDSSCSSSSCSSSSNSSSSSSSMSNSMPISLEPNLNANQTRQEIQPSQSNLTNAEILSERIRRTVMEHNYLLSLLVNIIRQHDRQRDYINQERRQQLTDRAQFMQPNHFKQPRIDLADISNSLNDGCLCLCHSHQIPTKTNKLNHSRCQADKTTNTTNKQDKTTTPKQTRSSTLPALLSPMQLKFNNNTTSNNNNDHVPIRKVRRLKKLRGSQQNGEDGFDLAKERQEILNQFSDKLCENCFETHYWLHACWSTTIELSTSSSASQSLNSSPRASTTMPILITNNDFSESDVTNIKNINRLSLLPSSIAVATATKSSSLSSTDRNFSVSSNVNQTNELNAMITFKNATFIKLVQQKVRSTISQSIELIDLIRKEIKSPESIKQKQLMKCFSSSIQLLTSVSNYVVPSQDISTFIPDVGFEQTTLFCLPPSDFDHLLIYPSAASVNSNQLSTSSNYHLANAPDIPICRRQQLVLQANQQFDTSLPTKNSDANSKSNTLRPQRIGEHLLSSSLRRLKTTDTLIGDSSSGASSNNSSASSSIARGGVQQSSITRSHTSSEILGSKINSHGLSFETIANLSRQQNEDDALLQSRPKFWQSSKFNFIKKLLHVKEQRLQRQQSKDRRIYNNKVQNKFRLVMRDLTHFHKSQQLLATENGVNSLLTSMRNVLEFGLYLTLKLY